MRERERNKSISYPSHLTTMAIKHLLLHKQMLSTTEPIILNIDNILCVEQYKVSSTKQLRSRIWTKKYASGTDEITGICESPEKIREMMADTILVHDYAHNFTIVVKKDIISKVQVQSTSQKSSASIIFINDVGTLKTKESVEKIYKLLK